MVMRIFGASSAVATLFVCAACGSSSLELLSPGGDGGAATTPDGGTLAGGGREAYCSGSGSPILTAGDGGASACVGGLAQETFRWALCSCEGLVSATALTTDSFDSTQGPYDAGSAHPGGAVGTNGHLNAQGTLGVGGALWISDSSGMTVASASTRGDLYVGGPVSSGPSLSVSGDAYVLGDVTANGNLSVAGTLHQPAGASVSAQGTKSLGGTATGSFSVLPPCDCDPALLVDVASYVEAYRADNDDSAVGIDPGALANVTTETTLAVPCGRIFFSSVGGTAAITLTLSAGRTAIFVGGDLSSNGAFSIDAPPSSEVDLFVEGGVVTASSFTLGSTDNPSKARLWVGGTASVNLQNATLLAGNVYAPHSTLVLGQSPATVFGSVFVDQVSTQGSLTIHFDESVLSAGSACEPATGTCSSCHDCGNQACVAGVCGACTASSDCCAPLVCNGGTCVDVIP